MNKTGKLVTTGIALSLIFASSTNSIASTPKPVATTNPYGAAVAMDSPNPTDPILTVTNHSKVLHMTLNDLKKLGTTQISIYEPFVKTKQTFTVVSLLKIFKAAGITSKSSLITDALNDYIYRDTAQHFLDSNGQLAIARFGAAIPYDQGGPIRIIFPDGTTLSKNLNAWNWSLDVITVK